MNDEAVALQMKMDLPKHDEQTAKAGIRVSECLRTCH